jgi:transposase
MRIAPPINLEEQQRAVLERWTRGRRTEARLVKRAQIILLAASGLQNQEIAARIGTGTKTVCLWRKRFTCGGIEAIEKDAPRGGRGNRLADDIIKEVVRKTTQGRPSDATHWSRRTMASEMGISATSIGRIWKEYGLKPHLQRTFKVSNDPFFAEKVEDIVGLYLNPPENAVVLSVDEKSQIQALDRTQPGLPLKKGRAGTLTHDYKRNGTTTLFAAMCTITGIVISQCMQRHRHQEWLKFLRKIDDDVPEEWDIHVVCDNYSTHKHAKVQRWLKRHPRFHVHFTPTSASWLNIVERFFREITEKRIRRGVFRSVPELVAAIEDFIGKHNDNPKPFVWVKSAQDILAKVARARAALHKSPTG